MTRSSLESGLFLFPSSSFIYLNRIEDYSACPPTDIVAARDRDHGKGLVSSWRRLFRPRLAMKQTV